MGFWSVHQIFNRRRGPEPPAIIDAGDTFEMHTYDRSDLTRWSDAFLYGCEDR